MTNKNETHKKLIFFLPVAVFAGLVILGLFGLGHNKAPAVQSSGRAVPVFSMQILASAAVFDKAALLDFAKQDWVLVNFFASWCLPCLAEHDFIKTLPVQLRRVGIAYKDKEEATQNYLTKHGNPYGVVAQDREGRAALEWGVTGVPETFLIAPDGVIAVHFSGPLTSEIWQKKFKPFLPPQFFEAE